ncbi:MAG: YggS family pyridoxal phosphate-dependent enzyme [Ilumatobacteraceae bacterium]|nr:YggS family pyridoxal phosphate-dependent enzyme [Ilumatobacteraceae bacterium]
MSVLGGLAERLQQVRQQITEAGGSDVEILAVTKGHPVEVVQAAVDVGLKAVGENYAQELVAKFDRNPFGISVHFIGQLQTNKVRQIVDLVDVYETVDRAALVVELAKRAQGAHVLVQVNTTDDPRKGGCAPEDADALVTQSTEAGLVVDGLMTVGPTTGGPENARAGFRLVRGLCDDFGLATCSMGMSDDFVVAVQEGSTRVRLGSVLFGMRPAATPRVR